jgi:hypothetical protein
MPAQIIPGALNTGAVGTALLGHSPDGSTRAVFSVVLADGSLIQAHTGKAVDGLASAGTVSPLLGQSWPDGDEDTRAVTPRLGVLLNYSPKRILYISEPFQNTIAVLGLTDDHATDPANALFQVTSVARIQSEALNQPVDLAPVAIETGDPNWASNTTLSDDHGSDDNGGSDFYVANRGNNTIVRMRQNGTVVAVREVRLAQGQALGNGRLNGIATSADGTKIWVTVAGHLPGQGNLTGAVLELPSF